MKCLPVSILGSVSNIKSVVSQLNGPVSDDDKTVTDTKIIIILVHNIILTSVSENTSYCTTERNFLRVVTFRKLMIRHWWQSPLFSIILWWKICFFIKQKPSLKFHGSAFTRNQAKYMKYVSFPWTPVVAALSTSRICFFFIYTCWESFIPHLPADYDALTSEINYLVSSIKYNF